MKIIKPLSNEHIQAANDIYAQCPNWKKALTATSSGLSWRSRRKTPMRCLIAKMQMSVSRMYFKMAPVRPTPAEPWGA